MPDIGLFELLLIGVLLFVVVGPERMPDFFGQIGRWARFTRDWWSQLGRELDREAESLRSPFREVQGEARAVREALQEAGKDATRAMKTTDDAPSRFDERR
ncbi:MAG: hypothetical protein D6794_00980 [Deltaproteobacteria bacterium]|nr:MAG: hypothetical protein D6794_00980 [Deltaproteobacteria bacterium]